MDGCATPTRLAEAVLIEARRRGWFSAVGHCCEMEGSPPYLPFLELLEYIARAEMLHNSAKGRGTA